MNLNAKYDVFVSYSRTDYVDENKKPIKGSAVAALLDFLDKNKITYWFDKDGIYSGSEFVEVITDAITDSKMMIFVSSEHSNSSPWTTGEIFEALEQGKLIVPFKIDNSLYNKKFRMMVRPLDFIEYFINPDVAFESLLKSINVCKDEYAKAIAGEEKRKAEENAKQRRAEILEEIKTESLDYYYHASTLAQDAQRLAEKQKMVGNKEKKCPVCSTMQPIDTFYCNKCGWMFNPVFDAHPKGDKDHLFVMRSLWNAVHDTDAIRINLENKIQDLESLRKEKEALMAAVQSLRQQLEETKANAQRISMQSIDQERSMRYEIETFTQKLTGATKVLSEKDIEIASLQEQVSEAKISLINVKEELKAYKDAEQSVKGILIGGILASIQTYKSSGEKRKPETEKTRCVSLKIPDVPFGSDVYTFTGIFKREGGFSWYYLKGNNQRPEFSIDKIRKHDPYFESDGWRLPYKKELNVLLQKGLICSADVCFCAGPNRSLQYYKDGGIVSSYDRSRLITILVRKIKQ